jgi:hypothetical protein
MLVDWYECTQLLDSTLPYPPGDENLGCLDAYELPPIEDIISQRDMNHTVPELDDILQSAFADLPPIEDIIRDSMHHTVPELDEILRTTFADGIALF